MSIVEIPRRSKGWVSQLTPAEKWAFWPVAVLWGIIPILALVLGVATSVNQANGVANPPSQENVDQVNYLERQRQIKLKIDQAKEREKIKLNQLKNQQQGNNSQSSSPQASYFGGVEVPVVPVDKGYYGDKMMEKANMNSGLGAGVFGHLK